MLAPATRIGSYEIVAPLGSGGMGEVHRARDTRLARDVAIKALPEAFAADPERLARFEREARVLASLSHPNLAGIFGIEEHAGNRYLVLEFVEGETLAARLRRGALPMDEALDVCRQIAAGIEAAHESGVVHRDLKPGNVMLAIGGAAKVLDFGLAKGVSPPAAPPDAHHSASPTLTVDPTSAGVILGTAAYMSPEQARGRPVDRRTDIWSFGCVLYECLTGRQAYEGETLSDLIARILEREPDWSRLPPATPPRMHELLRRCLRKDARERLRDMGEARIALAEIEKGGAPLEPAAMKRPAARPSAAILIGAAVLVALISVLAARLVWRAPAPTPVALGVILPPGQRLYGGIEANLLAIAPDGQALVYASQGTDPQRLYLRRLDRTEAAELPGTVGARNPFFSPDGEWIAFFGGHFLRKLSVHGGTPVDLAEVGEDRGGAWLEDGTIMYSPTFASPLMRIPAAGGTPRPFTTIDSTGGERSHRWPCALPGGKWVVFTVGKNASPGGYDDADLVAVAVDTRERRVLAQGNCARAAPNDRLVFARAGSLYALPVNPRDPRGGAVAVPVLDGVLGEPTSGAVFFDVSRNGTLAMVAGRYSRRESRLAWMDHAGRQALVPGEPRSYLKPELSPDGTRALAQIGQGGARSDVFLIDLARGTQTQLAFGGSPMWMPDGRHFAWSRRSDGGGNEIVMRSLLGGDSARVLARLSRPPVLSDVTADGRGVLFSEFGNVQSDILVAPTDGSAIVHTLVGEPLSQSQGVISPDGRWIAYTTDESGQREVCVRPLGRAGGRVQISAGGSMPVWSPQGRVLYYLSGDSLVAARMAIRGDAMFADTTWRVLVLPFDPSDRTPRNFDIDPSGNRFLILVPEGGANELREISVTLNWTSSLRSKSHERVR